MKVDADDLISFAKTLEGQTLETLSRKSQFTVHVTQVGMDYTPRSTGSKRNLWNEKSVWEACNYVTNEQGDKLPDFDWW